MRKIRKESRRAGHSFSFSDYVEENGKIYFANTNFNAPWLL